MSDNNTAASTEIDLGSARYGDLLVVSKDGGRPRNYTVVASYHSGPNNWVEAWTGMKGSKTTFHQPKEGGEVKANGGRHAVEAEVHDFRKGEGNTDLPDKTGERLTESGYLRFPHDDDEEGKEAKERDEHVKAIGHAEEAKALKDGGVDADEHAESHNEAYDLARSLRERGLKANVKEDALEDGEFFVQVETLNTTLTPDMMEACVDLGVSLTYVGEDDGSVSRHMWNVER